jgi:drug/metabolite transporter (DMT)-like permease
MRLSPRHKQASPLRGIVLLALLSLFWGLAWPAMKIVLGEIRPWTFRAICLAAGGAALLALSRAGGVTLRVPAGDLKPLIITSLINITGWHILSAYGLAMLHAGRAVIIAYTMPLWAILLGRLLLKEHITSARLWALGFGWTGLALLLVPEMRAFGAAPLGALMVLGAAVCWGAGTVLVKYFKWHMPGTLVMGWQLLIGGIPIVVGAILIDPVAALATVSWKAIAALIFVVALPTIFCHWAFFTVVQIFPANVAALSTLGIPVIGVFSSTLILGEPVTAAEVAALFLVVLSLALTSRGGRRTG